MSRWERGAIVLTPLAAVVTMAAGLRIGASPAVHAAIVYGAPPSADRAGLAWQLLTLVDDRSVREAVAMQGLSLVARSGDREARWQGATNADGVAEVWLDLPGVSAGDPVSIEVTAPGERSPLALGPATWPNDVARAAPPNTPVFARPSKREGELQIDVAVYAGHLVPGFPTSLWVHVSARDTGAPVAGVAIDADPEPGLALEKTHASSDADGWAELRATAEIHVVALGLRAGSGSPGGGARRGEWYGALPVAPGAAWVDMPLRIGAGEPHTFGIDVPTVLPRVYAEIDDVGGRALAVAVDVDRSGPTAHASVRSRALPRGDYWLVTSGDPRGAEGSGAALARPFVALGADDPVPVDLGARLATRVAPRFARFVALDGLPGKRRADGGRRRRGFALAFGSLAVAAALETLLILRGVERARRELARVSELLEVREATIERRFSAASVAIGILLAVLGFALLAALLTWRAS